MPALSIGGRGKGWNTFDEDDIWIMNPKECDLELNYEDKVCRYWMGSIVACNQKSMML